MAEALAEIAELQGENRRLRNAINVAAKWLRGPLDARSMNEAIRSLNTVIAPQDRILEVAWGVASLGALQRAAKNLCNLLVMPEYTAFLTQRITDEPPAPMKRQRPGGFPV